MATANAAAKLQKKLDAEGNNKAIAMEPVKKTILQEAHEVIYGDREQVYGAPAKNLKVIAQYWSIHLSATTGENIVLTAEDVCEMMILLKVARLANTPSHRDSLCDIAGYAALVERL
jgi:hypothetical protein